VPGVGGLQGVTGPIGATGATGPAGLTLAQIIAAVNTNATLRAAIKAAAAD
jgi:hypothetical protein